METGTSRGVQLARGEVRPRYRISLNLNQSKVVPLHIVEPKARQLVPLDAETKRGGEKERYDKPRESDIVR